MKKLNMIFYGLCLLAASCSTNPSDKSTESQVSRSDNTNEVQVIKLQYEPDTLKGSLKAEAKGALGGTAIKIRYHSPAVRGRVIWGGLVSYDRVWVAGAHMATSIEFDASLSIQGSLVPAGKYGLFMIPSQKNWTIIFNKNWQQHLTDEYNENDDVLRFEVTPQIQDVSQERLMYSIEGYEIKFRWEKVMISIPIVDVR